MYCVSIVYNTNHSTNNALTDGSGVRNLVGPAFGPTPLHGFDQFTGLLPSTFGTAAIYGGRITETIGCDAVFVHLFQKLQCLGPEFFFFFVVVVVVAAIRNRMGTFLR